MTEIKYPNITVELAGQHGNAFAILGRVMLALRRAGVDKIERDKFLKEASGGDNEALLATCCRWVDCR